MYDLSFNSAILTNVLRPGCTLPNNLNSGIGLNSTLCNNAIKYVGSSIVPVYTPTCFELGSSLSHFEDQLYPNCTMNNGNDAYFVVSNANVKGSTKRYLKPEERNVLCDIGYNVKTTFGVNTTSSGFYSYGGSTCAGITVAGLNDGINSNGDYTFIGNANSNIIINGSTILSNDVSATGFECLQDISATSNLSTTSGTTSTIVNFSSATTGFHMLRYIPINGIKKGNITYIYVYIRAPASTGGCSPTPNACNLVMNGDFEQISSEGTIPTIKKACGWGSVYQPPINSDSGAIARYFSSTANSIWSTANVPCNWFGNQSSNNNVGAGYAGIQISTGVGGKQHIYTTLKTPLQPNTNYQLSFDVSLADGFSYWASNLQAFLHRSNATPPSILPYNYYNGNVSIINNSIDNTLQLISPTVTRNTNGWDTITFNFNTTTGGEQFLYLGLLNGAILVPNTPAVTGLGGCNYSVTATNYFGNSLISYYIDNVSLIPTNGAKFNLPSTICNTQTLNDLSIYLSGAKPDGVFFGTGVTPTNGMYSFNAGVAGIGIKTIGYTFVDSSGCTVTLYSTINVNTTNSNNNTVVANNDNLTNIPINNATSKETSSVYINDLYNGVATTTSTLTNISFELVPPLTIPGSSINGMGYIFVPAGTPAGTYALNYRIKVIGNCSSSSSAVATILVVTTTPTIVQGIRANNSVLDVDFQSTGKSIISGSFTTYNNIFRKGIARLNTNLTLDESFLSTVNYNSAVPIQEFVIKNDDKIVVAGLFNYVSGNPTQNNISQLLPDGTNDSSFNIGITSNSGNSQSSVLSIKKFPSGHLIVGGSFKWYNGIQKNSLVKLDSNGAIDTSFNMPILAGYGNTISDIIVQPDGKILVAGYFYIAPSGALRNVMRLMPDGSVDTTFTQGDLTDSIDPNLIGVGGFAVSTILLQQDGKILVVGAFTKYNGVNVKCIVRLLSNGNVDSSFNYSSGVNRKILEVMLETVTNKILIGGEFDLWGTTPIKKMVRLNTNGTLDTTFSIGSGTFHSSPITSCPYCLNNIWTLKQQTDGKIIVGGSFTNFNGLSATNITRILGNAGVQAKSRSQVYESEPEIDINPTFNNYVLVYPNPSKGIFNINLTEGTETYNMVSILNILGEKVYTLKLIEKENNTINLSHLANGYYFARLENQTNSKTIKLIKN